MGKRSVRLRVVCQTQSGLSEWSVRVVCQSGLSEWSVRVVCQSGLSEWSVRVVCQIRDF